jgi:anti-anti-sigma factor
MKDVNARGLRVEVRRNVVVIRLPERAGWHNFPEIRDALCRAMAGRRDRSIVIDFTGTILVDTAGLVLLARTYSRARLVGCPVRIVVPATAPSLRHALHTSGLDVVLPPFELVDDAIAATSRLNQDADMTRVLEQIRMLNRRHDPLSPPGQGGSDTGLAITVDQDLSSGTARLRLIGALTYAANSKLATELYALVGGGRHHLIVELHTGTGEVGDVLSVLLGIRWQAAALGGCLAVPVRPERLDRAIRQGALEGVFAPCPDCATEPVSDRPSTAMARGSSPDPVIGLG